ncbi:Uma2 family endonuclease [Streptomyces sp. UNOB3_S3]|uniref:Uma2 family endonuclease n=1 Tax=Streptomyces sp. UNOB3_S3 TaxID=2871682 RepID=UPI001E6086B2|nr:Uma2 family endonuclease [Streptomyces sp. UNOB3_S3]MCC3773599.1 Uma2 family endonuclease [Streptomyces sp. UNOB3_S3]
MAAVRDSAELDAMFDEIENLNLPADYRVEIIEGEIVMNPQRKVHARIIQLLTMSLADTLGRNANVLWDVRVDFPGHLNGFAPDVALVKEGAEEDDAGNHDYRDVEFVAEVVSRGSRRADYEAKLNVYAVAGVPTYLIVDPKSGLVHVHHDPREGTYIDEVVYTFGSTFTLPHPKAAIDTSLWPRDRRAPRA